MDAAALAAAFRNAVYRVDAPEGRFDLQIGVADRALDDCLLARGVSCWGIITACNPGARRLSNEANRLRQAQLQEKLRRQGREFFDACNLDLQGRWPPEPGCFVLQISQEDLLVLAAEFSQLAVVRGERGLPPNLLWI